MRVVRPRLLLFVAIVASACGNGVGSATATDASSDATAGVGTVGDAGSADDTETTGPPAVVGPTLSFIDITQMSTDLVDHPHGAGVGWGGVDMYSPGMALVDLDGDDALDLVQPRNHRSDPSVRDVTMFRGRGDGSFQRQVDLPWSSGDNPMGVVAFDYDGDDDLDVFVAVDGGPSRLFRNDGAWTFADVTAEAGVSLDGVRAFTAAAADTDGDGDLDLYVGAWNEGTDLEGSAPNVLLVNLGDGTFADGTEAAGVACHGWSTLGQAFADLDADGDQDLYVANDFFHDCLYENKGNGTFVDVAAEAGIGFGAKHAMGVAVADMDGDGWLDIFVTDDGGEDDTLGNPVYFSTGSGGLAYVDRGLELGLDGIESSGLTWNVCWGVGLVDLDLDADLDVHIATHNDRPELWWQRDDRGQYRQDLDLAEPGIDARGSTYGDVDRDGDLDVVVGVRNGPLTVLRNDTDGGGSITVAPRPHVPAVGARVRVTVGDAEQLLVVQAGSSYMSTNPYEVVVGLGEASAADRVEVTFADGTVRELTDVAVGSRVVVDATAP